MKRVLRAKLATVPEFRNLLETHKDKTFAEATKHPIWGIGHSLGDNDSTDPAKWSGKNLMGKLLNEIIDF